MSIMMIIGIVALGLVVALVFSRPFRQWLGRQLNAIGMILQAVLPTIWQFIVRGLTFYGMFILGAASLIFILIVLSLIFHSSGFTAFAFLLAIGLILLTWLPAGLILRLFRVNSAVIPPTLKMIISYVAFFGFVGMLYPELLTFKSLCGAAFFGLIALGVSTQFNFLDKIIFPLTIGLVLLTGWKYFLPENFRTSVRYLSSLDMSFGAWKDRASIENEANASATYGQLIRDIEVLYRPTFTDDTISDLKIVNLHLSKDTLIKVFNHKSEIRNFEGQGFMRIQLMNPNKSFVKGKTYWVEADLVRLVTPKELAARYAGQEQSAPTESRAIVPDTLYPGQEYRFDMDAGAISGPKYAKGKFCAGSDQGDQFELIFPRSGKMQAWKGGTIPNEQDFAIYAIKKQTVTIKVI